MNGTDVANAVAEKMGRRIALFFAILIVLSLIVVWKDWLPVHASDTIVLEVVLDPDHPGRLLCNKPNAQFAPCTVEPQSDGWTVRFTEDPHGQ